VADQVELASADDASAACRDAICRIRAVGVG
jgi:hypothetical protein